MQNHGWTIYANEESKYKRSYVGWFHMEEMSKTGKSIQGESRLVVSKGWEKEEIRNDCWVLGIIWEIMKLIWNYIMVVVSQLCKQTENYWLIHEMRNFVMYKLCHHYHSQPILAYSKPCIFTKHISQIKSQWPAYDAISLLWRGISNEKLPSGSFW